MSICFENRKNNSLFCVIRVNEKAVTLSGDSLRTIRNISELFHFLFYPLACVDKCFDPRSDLIALQPIRRIVGILPGEHRTLQVWHHRQMTSIGAGNGSYGIVRTVRITWVFIVRIFCHKIVIDYLILKRKFSFSLSHPDSQNTTSQ